MVTTALLEVTIAKIQAKENAPKKMTVTWNITVKTEQVTLETFLFCFLFSTGVMKRERQAPESHAPATGLPEDISKVAIVALGWPDGAL